MDTSLKNWARAVPTMRESFTRLDCKQLTLLCVSYFGSLDREGEVFYPFGRCVMIDLVF